MTDRTRPGLPRASHRRTALRAGIFAVALTGAPTLVAGFSYVIFDPSNFAKNVQQTLALIQQIDRAAQQIRQQQQMLAHLPTGVADTLVQAALSFHGSVGAVFSDRSADATGVADQLESQYPIVFPQTEVGWREAMNPAWNARQRAHLLRERDLIQQVHDQMPLTVDQLRTLVEASNGVNVDRHHLPGVVAVAQAQQQLLALCTHEADKLIALRAARAGRRDALRAQAQSESAYSRARRAQLLIDWNVVETPPPPPIRHPFIGVPHP